MKTHKIIPLIACLLLIGSAAMAQPAPPPPKPPQQVPGMRMMQMLNLTQEQRDKMMDMRLQMAKDMLPLRTQMDNLRSDLKLTLTADNFDQKKVNKTIDQISDVRKQMTLKMIQHMRGVRNMLTPDQQKKFDLMIMSNKRDGFGMMDGMGHRGIKGSDRMMRHNMKAPRNSNNK